MTNTFESVTINVNYKKGGYLMSHTVYTVYWENRLAEKRKEHGSYPSEEAARSAIETWWEIHKEKYHDVEEHRTNSGALEISYGDPNYVYRIEARQSEHPLPKSNYKLMPAGQVDSLRQQLHLDEDQLLFDQLAEPYRDRLIKVMVTGEKAREYIYNSHGEPIIKVKDLNKTN